MVKLQMPKTLGGGNNAYGMTQKMCDAYYMANGDEFSREHLKKNILPVHVLLPKRKLRQAHILK